MQLCPYYPYICGVMEDIIFNIYMFVFWVFWLLVLIAMFQDSYSFIRRRRLTDKQQKELDELHDKWERERQEEEAGKQKEEKP